MNIFYLSNDPHECVKLYYDTHVRKMVLETAQILCTVRHKYGLPAHYQASHKHHPCIIWAGESKGNYEWLCKLGLALSEEFLHRFGKVHKSESIIVDCLYGMSEIRFPKEAFYEPPLCMDDCYKLSDTISSYIQYYKYGKMHLYGYTNREFPAIFND